MRRFRFPASRALGIIIGAAVNACGGGGDYSTEPVVPPQPEPPPPSVEARALWVTRFEYSSAAQVVEIISRAAAANFNIVYFQVRGAGDAFYRSSLEPCAVAVCGKLGGATMAYDPLAVAVDEARARGIQIHAWINALAGWSSGSNASCALLTESDPGQPRHMLKSHPEWVMVNANGSAQQCPNSEEYVYVTPGDSLARTHLARVVGDIARKYAVDGIHLDRIRYPGTAWSHDSASLRAFGKDPASDPAGWAEFRRSRVNAAVREVSDTLRAARPSAVLSAAVWGIYDDRWGWGSSRGYSQYFQDPRAWAAGGYLDIAVPMTYYAVHAQYCGFADWACLADDHLTGFQNSGRHVYLGIAANRGAAEVERQIRLGRTKAAKGFAIFSYTSASAAGLFASLPAALFSNRAQVPPLSWR